MAICKFKKKIFNMLPYKLLIEAGLIAHFGKPFFKSLHLPFFPSVYFKLMGKISIDHIPLTKSPPLTLVGTVFWHCFNLTPPPRGFIKGQAPGK